MSMKFVLFAFLFCIFQSFVWAEESPNNKKTLIHIDHLDHVPHHPKGKDPTEKSGHDGIIYPRKKTKKWILELA